MIKKAYTYASFEHKVLYMYEVLELIYYQKAVPFFPVSDSNRGFTDF